MFLLAYTIIRHLLQGSLAPIGTTGLLVFVLLFNGLGITFVVVVNIVLVSGLGRVRGCMRGGRTGRARNGGRGTAIGDLQKNERK